MKSRAMFVPAVMGVLACAITCGVTSAAAQPLLQNPPVLMPPPVPPSIPPPPPSPAPPDPGLIAEKAAEAKHLAANITAYATSRCGGKDSAAAPDCWAKSLWDATQCPPEDASAKKDALANRDSTAEKDAAPAKKACVPGGPGFEYDVVSIKPHKDDGRGGMFMGGSDDGFRAINTTMQNAVLNAYSTGLQIEITGGPAWARDENYDIEAKYVPEVGEALRKLSGGDSNFARRYMMQQILKERMNLAAHAETKDVPAYDLVIGKNGPKFKDADPNEKNIGRMSMRMDQGKWLIDGQGIQLAGLARNLGQFARRPVFDKTGLTGRYDIKLEFAREQPLSAGAPTGGAAGSPSDLPADPTGGPTIMAALEEQLGLKLVPSRGPMMIVVIEHIDKPDAN
ncbi:MAG TPA: TIGR03435 family protein [Candidatus Acidoferrum sp.]|nr:TIGR03435 family protein [Candidatus Acidoferrum sp.]